MDYMAKNGILLDMVGSKNALFAREEMSAIYDNNFLGKVWQTGANIGSITFATLVPLSSQSICPSTSSFDS